MFKESVPRRACLKMPSHPLFCLLAIPRSCRTVAHHRTLPYRTVWSAGALCTKCSTRTGAPKKSGAHGMREGRGEEGRRVVGWGCCSSFMPLLARAFRR